MNISQKKKKCLALGCQAAANAAYVLHACRWSYDPTLHRSGNAFGLFDSLLRQELPLDAATGLCLALGLTTETTLDDDEDDIDPKDRPDRMLWRRVVATVADGAEFDLGCRTNEQVHQVETIVKKRRAAKVNASISTLAKTIAGILGPSPQAEAFASRWICCAIEGLP